MKKLLVTALIGILSILLLTSCARRNHNHVEYVKKVSFAEMWDSHYIGNPLVVEATTSIAKRQAQIAAEEARGNVKAYVNAIVDLEEPVYFEFDKSRFTPRAMEQLKLKAQILKMHPNLSVDISGYASNPGTRKYNELLSKKRALRCKAFLACQGVTINQVNITFHGESIAAVHVGKGQPFNQVVQFKAVPQPK